MGVNRILQWSGFTAGYGSGIFQKGQTAIAEGPQWGPEAISSGKGLGTKSPWQKLKQNVKCTIFTFSCTNFRI